MFGFLNTLLLSALGLALIPVIIHLLNRRKSVKVPFSSLRFLKMLQKKQMKNVRIRQIILLILRTLILLLVVIAFARPTWRSGSQPAIEAHERTSLILIADHSMSTAYQDGQGVILDRIKQKAAEIIRHLKEGDEAILLTTPGTDEKADLEFSRQFSEIRSHIQRLSPAYSPSDIRERMELAAELMKKAKNPNREIIVLSDMQKNAFAGENPFQQVHGGQPVSPHWLFIDFSPETFRNAGIDTVTVLSRIIERNKALKIRAKVSNHSSARAEDVGLRMYFNGKKVVQQSVSIGANDAVDVELAAVPSVTGYVQAMIEIDDDELMADNQYHFNFYIPDRIRTLLVQAKPSPYRFIELALKPTPHFRTPVTLESMPFTRWSSINWNQYDVILMSNLPALEDIHIQPLEHFLKKGKGVMLIPGDDAAGKSYSDGIFRRLDIGSFRSLTDLSGMSGQSAGFGELRMNHLLLQGIFEQGSRGEAKNPESPAFYKYWNVEPGGSSSSVIHLSNRVPWLTDTRYGKGRILFLASAVDLKWTDLPLRGLFPPLMHRAVLYLYSSSQGPESQYLCGSVVELRVPAGTDGQLKIRDGSGNELKPRSKALGDETLIHIPGFGRPGAYSVADRDRIIRLISVNHHARESVPLYLNQEELGGFMGDHPFERIASGTTIEDYILTSRFGHELWKWFLALSLLLLAIEMVISQSHRFERK